MNIYIHVEVSARELDSKLLLATLAAERGHEVIVSEIEVIEKVEIHPKIKIECSKCKNKVAYYWTQQTRGADEPETRFFKCTKCNYTWREYS